MCKNLKGYLTVEASFVMPLVIFLYLLIILCGFLLYNRCIISQNDYLVAFRGSRFTEAGINYGEVIYGDMMLREPNTVSNAVLPLLPCGRKQDKRGQPADEHRNNKLWRFS